MIIFQLWNAHMENLILKLTLFMYSQGSSWLYQTYSLSFFQFCLYSFTLRSILLKRNSDHQILNNKLGNLHTFQNNVQLYLELIL